MKSKSMAYLEQKLSTAQKTMADAVRKEFPVDSDVLVQIRTGQRTLTPAIVLAVHTWSPTMVRVRLSTKGGKVVDVHYTNVFPAW